MYTIAKVNTLFLDRVETGDIVLESLVLGVGESVVMLSIAVGREGSLTSNESALSSLSPPHRETRSVIESTLSRIETRVVAPARRYRSGVATTAAIHLAHPAMNVLPQMNESVGVEIELALHVMFLLRRLLHSLDVPLHNS